MSQRKRELQKKINNRKKELADLTWKQMTRNYEDVLQNIEFALVACARADSRVDDATVLAGLQAKLKKLRPDDELIATVVDRISEIRELRMDVTDSVWDNCLQVVIKSVRTHSSLAKGSHGYLNFVVNFIP